MNNIRMEDYVQSQILDSCSRTSENMIFQKPYLPLFPLKVSTGK